MKKVIRLLIALGLFLSFGFLPNAKACNLSDVSLLSITSGPGSNTTISFRLCIGFGLTGSTKGADNATNGITFGWFTTQTAPAFSIVSYTPTAISSPAPNNCTMTSFNLANPPGAFVPAKIGTFFTMPGSCANRFLCVNSTPLCNNVGQLCFNFSFVVNFVPDSMRVFGVEGAGNAVAGCYPNADMLLNLTLFPVIWGPIEAKLAGKTVEVDWSTIQEVNSDQFFVERMNQSGEFELIATLPAVGNSSEVTNYRYTDVSPLVGTNRYRVVQVSKDAISTQSPNAEVHFQGSDEYAWGAIGPVPAENSLRVNFLSPADESGLKLQLVDVSGKLLLEKTIDGVSGTNKIDMDLSTVQAGIYFVRLKAKTTTLFYKVIKV